MNRTCLLIIASVLLAALRLQAAPRTVMVQMFEWPWADIARECETYLGPKGFSAVQVSPPQEHLVLGQNAWWERYQPVGFNLISRAGDEAGFRDMVRRCQTAGVDIYVDAVLNHMAGIAEGVGFAGTRYTKYNHPGIFSGADFHFCGKNGNNQIQNYHDRYELQFCELLGLADLKTESPYVQNTLAAYLNRLLDMGVAGFRLDAAKHVPAGDLAAIIRKLKRPAYIVSETFLGANEAVSYQEYFAFGDVNLFSYSWDLTAFMSAGRLAELPRVMSGYFDSRYAVVFVENHDLQRSPPQTLSYASNQTLYMLANVFMLTYPYGYPQVFSGYAFSNYDAGPPVDGRGRTLPVKDANGDCRAPWLCEHRLPGIAAMVRFRNQTDSAFYTTKMWSDRPGTLAYSRGRLGFVAINRDGQSLQAQIPTDLPDGVYCDLLTSDASSLRKSCGRQVNVVGGRAQVSLPPMTALVLLASERFTGWR